MTTSQIPETKRKLCSVFSSENNEDPAGSATWWRRCLIVEVPEPWASEINESRNFPSEVSTQLANASKLGVDARLHCVTPDNEYSSYGNSRVMLFSKPDGPSASFIKEEYLVPTDQIGYLIESLMVKRDNLAQFDKYSQDTNHLRDVFVCTHGAQDTCCGSVGYPIYSELRNRYATQPNLNLRVWRVSHLGGHRFAPNLLDMPEGRNWVRMRTEQLEALIFRTGQVSELRDCYRGSVSMESPYEQVAEREAFVRNGWGWATKLVKSQLIQLDTVLKTAEVRLDFASGSGEISGTYVAKVESIESAPRASCIVGTADGEAAQYKVVEWKTVT